MPYILSPEQKVVADALLHAETSSTKYFDLSTALQALSSACAKACREDQKILIHVPNSEQKNALRNILVKNGLDDLAIDLSSRNPIPEKDIIKLRSNIKKQKDTDAITTAVLSNKKAAALKNKVETFYKAFETKVLADVFFRDFTTNTIYNKRKGRPIFIIHSETENVLEFTASEYYKIKKEIINATSLYESQFELFDHLSFFKEDLWTGINDTKVNEVKNSLDLFKKESLALSNEFIELSNQLLQNSSKDLKHAFSILEEKFTAHENACIAYQIKSTDEGTANDGLFSMFKKKKNQSSNKIYIDAFDELSGRIKDLSQPWFDELDAPTSEMITYEYILNFIDQNRDKISAYKEKMIASLAGSVQRINKINTSSDHVKLLDKKLEDFIQKMNTSQLFDIELEHNILSFSKQLELSKNISDYLEKCHILVHSSSSYLEWKSFYNGTDNVFRKIFDSIKKMPKEQWVESYEHWYENQLQHQVLGKNTIEKSELSAFFQNACTGKDIEIAALLGTLHTQRLQGAEQLKISNKELYNSLFKKKQLPSTSWYDNALMNRTFMQAFFPIHIVDTLSYTKEYDLVISFDPKPNDAENAIHFFSPIESKDIQNMAEGKHNFLYLNDYNYSHPLSQLSSTDKLKASKKLAKYILSLNQNIKIYQLKNANIISLLPAHDDNFLENQLDALNAKVIDTNGVLYDRLTESILLTERNPILIVKDELVNPAMNEHILWQLQMIQLFDDVGYEIISINTVDQLKDNAAQFQYVLDKVSGQQTPHNELIAEDIQEEPVTEEV